MVFETKDFLVFFVECTVVCLICYAIYREKDLIKFELKVARFVKAFLKALYYTIKDQVNKIKECNKNV